MLQKRLAPCSTGPTSTSTTLYELGGNSSIIIRPSSVLQSTLQGLLHSLSASNPVYQGRFRRGLLHEALVLQVPALYYMSWEVTLASSYNPLQCCNSTLQGLLHSLSSSNHVYKGCFRRGLLHAALVLQVPALRYMSWEVTLASSYNPLQCCNSTLQGLLHSLSASNPVYQAHFRWGLLHEALVFQAEACSIRRWSSRYRHYVI